MERKAGLRAGRRHAHHSARGASGLATAQTMRSTGSEDGSGRQDAGCGEAEGGGLSAASAPHPNQPRASRATCRAHCDGHHWPTPLFLFWPGDLHLSPAVRGHHYHAAENRLCECGKRPTTGDARPLGGRGLRRSSGPAADRGRGFDSPRHGAAPGAGPTDSRGSPPSPGGRSSAEVRPAANRIVLAAVAPKPRFSHR